MEAMENALPGFEENSVVSKVLNQKRPLKNTQNRHSGELAAKDADRYYVANLAIALGRSS